MDFRRWPILLVDASVRNMCTGWRVRATVRARTCERTVSFSSASYTFDTLQRCTPTFARPRICVHPTAGRTTREHLGML